MPSISLKSLSEPDAAASPAPRIGIVIAHLGSGGAEKAAVVLANGLADRGYFVDLLTWQAAAFHLKDMSPKVTRIDLSAGRRPNTTQVIASLVRYLLQKQPAIIFPHLEKPSLLVIAGGLLTGYRRIVPCIQIDLIAYAAIHHNRRHRYRPVKMSRCDQAASAVTATISTAVSASDSTRITKAIVSAA